MTSPDLSPVQASAESVRLVETLYEAVYDCAWAYGRTRTTPSLPKTDDELRVLREATKAAESALLAHVAGTENEAQRYRVAWMDLVSRIRQVGSWMDMTDAELDDAAVEDIFAGLPAPPAAARDFLPQSMHPKYGTPPRSDLPPRAEWVKLLRDLAQLVRSGFERVPRRSFFVAGDADTLDAIAAELWDQENYRWNGEAALQFYADEKNWLSPSTGFAAQYDPEPSPVAADRGQRARSVLANGSIPGSEEKP